jgi:hypothetical protein
MFSRIEHNGRRTYLLPLSPTFVARPPLVSTNRTSEDAGVLNVASPAERPWRFCSRARSTMGHTTPGNRLPRPGRARASVAQILPQRRSTAALVSALLPPLIWIALLSPLYPLYCRLSIRGINPAEFSRHSFWHGAAIDAFKLCIEADHIRMLHLSLPYIGLSQVQPPP